MTGKKPVLKDTSQKHKRKNSRTASAKKNNPQKGQTVSVASFLGQKKK